MERNLFHIHPVVSRPRPLPIPTRRLSGHGPGRVAAGSAEPLGMRPKLALAFAAWAALAAALPPGALADASPQATLAARYSPEVRLVAQMTPCGAGEPFMPIDVDAVLGNDEVALRGPWQGANLVKVAPTAEDIAGGHTGYHLDFPGDALNPGCSYEQWERELETTAVATTYARVVSEQGQTALAYWFFYIYNDFNNKHEGDWEMIQLDFPAATAAAALKVAPSEVGYSQHDGAERAAWDASKLEKVDGTHPVVYPAEGSHANYYEPALYLGASGAAGVGCDNTRGPWRILRPAVRLVPDDPAQIAAQYPWLTYTGNWGEEHVAFYNGPTGPNVHSQWDHPITWAQTRWHPSAFAVPSGLTGYPHTTDVFCAGVAAGSNLLTVAVRGGAAVFLAILAVIVLLIWKALRIQRHPSQPFHVARRRSLGQILAASARLYRHNPRRFITIGALFVPISLVIAGLQALLFGVTRFGALQDVAGSTNAAVAGTAVALGLVLGTVGLTIIQALVAHAVARASADLGPDVRGAYAALRRRLRAIVVALVVVATVVVALDLTVVGIPFSIWLLVRWSLFAQCIVLEDLSWRAGLRRSATLVRGSWWRVAGIVLTVVGVALLLGPLVGILFLLTTPISLTGVNIVSGIVYVLTLPYAAITTAYLYYDLRVREQAPPEPFVLPAEAVLE